MTARKLRNAWWVDFRSNHQRYRVKSPENSKVGAEAYEALLRHKLARGESLKNPSEQKNEKEEKFKIFAWKWFETYVKTNNKPSEIGRKLYTLRTHLVPFFGDRPLDRIPTVQIEEYKARKLAKGLGPKTINNHLTVLSSCLRVAQDWVDLEKLPKIKKLKAPPSTFDFLTYEERAKLLGHATGLWRELILTALHTGLRQGELRGLSWSDIDWENKLLTVRHSWCEYTKGLSSPKGNKERHIPLTDELYNMLARRKVPMGLVFAYNDGRRPDGKRMNCELGRICTKAGIRRISFHTLRHTFASHLVMKNAPLKAIQELLGHANIQTTMRYAHLAPSSLKDTINLLQSQPVSSQSFGQPVGNAEVLFALAGNTK